MAEKSRSGKNIAASLDVRGPFKLAGTAVTASAAELNTIHSSGITAADAAKLHAVTSSAAELNTLTASGITNADLVKLHAVTATAANVNTLGAVAFDRTVKVALVPLAALDTGGGVLSWANPEAGSILVQRVILDVTTKSTGACTVDAGTTATTATTSSNNLLTALDVGAAAGVFDNIDDKGASGKSKQKLATGKWVTISKASGAAAGLVGNAYIHYVNI